MIFGVLVALFGQYSPLSGVGLGRGPLQFFPFFWDFRPGGFLATVREKQLATREQRRHFRQPDKRVECPTDITETMEMTKTTSEVLNGIVVDEGGGFLIVTIIFIFFCACYSYFPFCFSSLALLEDKGKRL